MGKKIRKILLILVSIFIMLIVAMAAYHHIKLSAERGKITPIGTKVKIDGYNMNVYTEGSRSSNDPVIVLLSGSGVPSPIYDYKILYSKLTDEFEVAVIEKFGYGYSDLCKLPRDITTIVEEDREALREAGVKPPYILMPHSMSGLEAIYWADTYPDEVVKMVGLDMAVPAYYKKESLSDKIFTRCAGIIRFIGIQRFVYPVNRNGLTDKEYEQNKILTYRNALNRNIIEGCEEVYDNAAIVNKMEVPEIPLLMFTTNMGREAGYESWVESQKDFAERAKNCSQIEMDCDHMLHYTKSDFLTQKIKKFLKEPIQ
jgi:hypothetical protein